MKNRDENQEALLYRLKLGPTAMLLWECCGNRWRNCCTLNLWRTGRWCTATEPSLGGGEEVRGKNQALSSHLEKWSQISLPIKLA